MGQTRAQGQIIILNGAPRSGKSSIVEVIQDTFDGVWMNLGVDGFMQMPPARYLPGIGLRPGGERQDIEPLVPTLYRALYESIAAHSRVGLNVVVDIGHHDAYAVSRGILPDCAAVERFAGLVRGRALRDRDHYGTATHHGLGDRNSGRRTGSAARAFVAMGGPHPWHL